VPHVSLVSLSGFRVHEQQLLQYGMTLPGFRERARALAELPALGLLTLAGLLPEHWSCSYRAPVAVDSDLVEHLMAEAPSLVALSALTASIEEAYRLSDTLRARGIKTVLGGLHVTACPDEAKLHADAIVVGPGERVWRELLEDAEQDALQEIYHTPRRASRGTSAEWPRPRLDLLGDVSRYTLQTQRGCPLACDFCAASRLLERFREKPAECIRLELEQITSLAGNPIIELADDNTFAGNRDFAELLEHFQDARVRWFTESDWRLGERRELLPRLARAGCVQVLVGIESIVFRYPGMGGKQAELQRIMDAVQAIQEAGVAVNGCFIVGADGESHESLEQLIEFLMESPLADIQLTVQTPFPGTALRERLKSEQRLLADRGWPHYSLFEVTYQPDRLSVSELERGFREAITHVYGPEATRRRRRIRRDVWRSNPRLRTAAAE
jgi:radical SAM superfamily enzyme YgiQ (UPF0313 family)